MKALDYRSPDARRCTAWLSTRLFRWHVWTAGILCLAFGAFTLIILLTGLDRTPGRWRVIISTTAATALGPMTGAVSRDFQGCCLEFSLFLLPWCLGGLITGVAVQFIVPARGPIHGTARVVAWVTGWVVWFGGGIVSFGHALS